MNDELGAPDPPPPVAPAAPWACEEPGRSREILNREILRLNMEVWGGGGLLRIDFPGMGIVTADDEGKGEDGDGEAMDMTVTRGWRVGVDK